MQTFINSYKVSFLSIIILFSFTFHLSAQKEIDSLRNLLPKTDGNQKIDVLNSLANYLSRINPSESKKILKESLTLSEINKYDKGKVTGLLVLATYFSRKNEFNKTDSILKIVFPLAEKINYQKGLADAQLTLGALRLRQGRYAEAIEQHFSGIKFAKKLNDVDLQVNHLLNIGFIKQHINDLNEAEKYWLEALEIAKNNNLNSKIGQVYLNLAVLQYKKNNIGLSIEYNKKALNIFILNNDLDIAAKALNNLGFANNILGKTDEAMKFYQESLEIRKKIDDNRGVARVLLNQAKILKENSQFKKAVALIDESIEILRKLNNQQLLKEAYEFQYLYYEESKNYYKALESYKMYSNIKDSLNFKANKSKVQELTAQYEFSKIEQKNKILNLEVDKKNQIIISISVFLLLVIFWVLKNRNKIKIRLKLSQKDLEIIKKDTELQIKEWEIEKKQLLKNAEIGLLKSRESNLFKKVFTNTKDRVDINKLIDSFKNSIVDKKDWITFRFYFDIFYPHFFDKLSSEKEVNLTINEQRLICLIKIKLTTKEIADILAISPTSVLKAKTRLKQKLHFNSIKALDNFLQNIQF